MLGVLAKSQESSLQFHHINGAEGFPQSSVLAITQDLQGAIWLGTRSGLYKYYGHSCKIYRNERTDSLSLSDNFVVTSCLDKKGNLWWGTRHGLNQYNSANDRFRRILANPVDPTALASDRINHIFEDHKEQLWIGTDQGLYLMENREKALFRKIFPTRETGPASGSDIRAITEDRSGNLWVGTSQELIRISWRNGKPVFQAYTPAPSKTGSASGAYPITALEVDWQNRLWIGVAMSGLFLLETPSSTFKHYPAGPNGLIHNNIRKILADKSGKLWIGTQEGLSILDPQTNTFSNYQHNPENKYSLSQNSIYDIFQDKAGSIWIGTYFGGVNMVYAYNTPFNARQFTYKRSSISNNVVSNFAVDKQGNIWIGTEGGGLNYWNRSTGQFSSFRNIPGDPGSISSNLVKTVLIDRRQNLWAGLHNGGLCLLPPGENQFTRFLPEPGIPGSIPGEHVHALLEDSYGRFWVGTETHGIFLMDRDKRTFQPFLYQPAKPFALSDPNVRYIYEDAARNIWVATESGVDVLKNQEELFVPLATWVAQDDALPVLSANCIFEMKNGRICIGAELDGLLIFDPATKKIRRFTSKNGLPGNTVYGMLQDESGHLWISTDNGLCRMDPYNETFITYNTFDGLPGDQFNNMAFFQNTKGEMFFGGLNGFVHFFPGDIEVNEQTDPVIITKFRIAASPKGPGSTAVEWDLGNPHPIALKHHQNVFTIEFASLNYIKPQKNLYAWKLEGFDQDWNYSANAFATYTNLKPGHYTFLVKSANNDGRWNNEPSRVNLRILPPVWKTSWAYGIYLIILSAIGYLIARFIWLRAKFRREAAMQEFKLDFFTNISHEIRTHLSLISAPVERLLLSSGQSGFQKKQLLHVKNNAEKLQSLVNEMMDLRKAETRHLTLYPTNQNFALFLHTIFQSFETACETKNITATFEAPQTSLFLTFDKVQLEKVFVNLLSNALKFTPPGGRIQIVMEDTADTANVKVIDNGPGIEKKHLDKIFTMYYQVKDGDRDHIGYGLGLALAKSITELHGGVLSVESETATADKPGYTCFTVKLPKQMELPSSEQAATAPQSPSASAMPSSDPALPNEHAQKQTLLLIEDNEELRNFLRESLEENYHILESPDGEQGLALAFEQIPDLIVSDIMMPGMDGLQLCRRIKQDERTNHIPVILLTAKSSQQHQVEGLQTGADAYITKPFSIQLLHLQIANLLASRAAMRQRYMHQVILQPSNLEITNVDEEFLNKAISIIELHLDDANFSVTVLATKLAMSQSVLYKKLKALTDMSVNDFIKSIRLKKAAMLLTQKQLNVNEVAYSVGFSDRKYFSREFKKLFGKNPSEYV